MPSLHPYLAPVAELFQEESDAERAAWMHQYLQQQFEHFGVPTATRRSVSKLYMKHTPLPNHETLQEIVVNCFEQPQREFQYFAVELLAFCKKQWQPDTIALMEYCLVTKSWWDSVDHVCSECLDPFFKKFPEQINPITSRWNASDHIWLIRSSILFQKKWKKATQTALLEQYILPHVNSKAFFVQKAIGWALREYARTNPTWVVHWVDTHPELPALSKREALKHFS